jgi:hypothetical protein
LLNTGTANSDHSLHKSKKKWLAADPRINVGQEEQDLQILELMLGKTDLLSVSLYM